MGEPGGKLLNRRILLKQRPRGEPVPEDFEMVTLSVPELGDGEVLLRNIYMSLDPYMRCRMNEDGFYTEGVKLGEPMISISICKILQSRNGSYRVGDWLICGTAWEEYTVINDWLTSKFEFPPVNLGPNPNKPSLGLGILGLGGFSAYMGLLDIGNPQPGETVVVSSAIGSVGSVVGQIAKIKGCRVVGIAGGKKKCEYAVSEFGFDACVDHSSPDLPELLKQACPNGIDVYFENVGGKLFETIIPLLNVKARVPVCGLLSMYNSTSSTPPGSTKLLAEFEQQIMMKSLKIQGFIIFRDYGHRFEEFHTTAGRWLEEGKLRYLEQVVSGFENTIGSFIGLLRGDNFGKTIIKIHQE